MSAFDKTIVVGARDSALSKVQVYEVLSLLQKEHPNVSFSLRWFKTLGDRDLKTSLTSMEKTNFFTMEIDEAVSEGTCDIGIHSAKDLPEPLATQLCVVAYTKGVDPADVIVFREGESLKTLKKGAKVGTSSVRREENVKALRDDLICEDIRGTIETRLSLLDQGEYDAVIMAKAALIRLKLLRNLSNLPGPTSPMQGRLAIVARKDNRDMINLFSSLNDVLS